MNFYKFVSAWGSEFETFYTYSYIYYELILEDWFI